MDKIKELIVGSRDSFDLTSSESQHRLYELAEKLLTFESLPDLNEKSLPLEFRMAGKLVKSRKAILSIKEPIKLGVVFAMWGEQNRVLPKSVFRPGKNLFGHN